MQVSGQENNYQMMNMYQMQNAQKPENSIQPVPNPSASKVSNEDIYEASNGNAIRQDGEITLTSQGELNVSNAQEANTAEMELAAQDEKDAMRSNATDYLAHQSKKSQVEIYLSVAADSKVEVGTAGDTASILESLRDVQKQNNAVAAYATYAENQKGGQAALL